MAQLRATVTAAALPQKSCRSAQAARSWICAGRAVGAHSTSSSQLDASSAPGAAAAIPDYRGPTGPVDARAERKGGRRRRNRRRRGAQRAVCRTSGDGAELCRGAADCRPHGDRSHECLLLTRGGVGSQACALHRSMRDRAASRWYMWQIRERCDARAACGCVEG